MNINYSKYSKWGNKSGCGRLLFKPLLHYEVRPVHTLGRCGVFVKHPGLLHARESHLAIGPQCICVPSFIGLWLFYRFTVGKCHLQG